MIGISISIGNDYARQLSSAQVTQYLTTVFGATLLGDWCFDDATLDSGDNATALRGRVSGTDLTLDGSRVVPTKLISGRRFSSLTSSTGRGLHKNAAWAPKQVIAVIHADTLPPSNSGYAVTSYGIQAPILVNNSGASTWHSSTWTSHSVDGTASSAILSGTHVYSSDRSVSTETGIKLVGAGAAYANSDFVGCIGRVVALSAVATAQQLADASAALRRYYRF